MENTINTQRHWVKSGREILELKLTKVPTLVEPFIPKYGAMSLAGSSDLGKSYLLLQLSDAIITGSESFIGFKLNATHKSAIYVCTEDDEYSLCPRLMIMSKGISDLSVYENLRVIFETKDLIKRLDVLLTERNADIVIIDTFTDIFDKDMNQANQVRSFIQKFKEIGVKHKTLIIFNHHCGKKNDYRPPHKDNLLGSQGFESSMRTVIELRKDFKDPNKRHLCIVKGNYLSESYKNSSFVLDFNFEDGFKNKGERVNFGKLAKSDESLNMEAIYKERVLKLKNYRQA
jgi:RecA-family ATPase